MHHIFLLIDAIRHTSKRTYIHIHYKQTNTNKQTQTNNPRSMQLLVLEIWRIDRHTTGNVEILQNDVHALLQHEMAT